MTGSLDYGVFGAPRAASGATSGLTFTSEQTDAETGFTYLRARYLDPAVGRFTSADTVQPNAPGTQGYNLCSYVANNPSAWVDPSGHLVDLKDVPVAAPAAVDARAILTDPGLTTMTVIVDPITGEIRSAYPK